MKFVFPLRFRIPLLLFVFGLIAIGIDLAVGLHVERRDDAVREALVVGSALALLCLVFWWILHRTLMVGVERKRSFKLSSGICF